MVIYGNPPTCPQFRFHFADFAVDFFLHSLGRHAPSLCAPCRPTGPGAGNGSNTDPDSNVSITRCLRERMSVARQSWSYQLHQKTTCYFYPSSLDDRGFFGGGQKLLMVGTSPPMITTYLFTSGGKKGINSSKTPQNHPPRIISYAFVQENTRVCFNEP